MRILRSVILAVGLVGLAAGCGGAQKADDANPCGGNPCGGDPDADPCAIEEGEELGNPDSDPCAIEEAEEVDGDPCGGEPMGDDDDMGGW